MRGEEPRFSGAAAGVARSQSLSSVCRSGPCAAAGELGTQLADRAVALGHDLVRMDRLEVELAREHEVVVREVGELVEDALQRDADGVLDEARLQVRVLDDEELVRALQQLVDR